MRTIVGPAGPTYDCAFIDGHGCSTTLGRLRMSEFVFNIGQPGVGASGHTIGADQAQEIGNDGSWRKA